MALTLDRWIAAAVAGCLVAVVFVLGGPDSAGTRRRNVPDEREILAQRERVASRAISLAGERLRMRVLRDSVSTVLAALPRSDTTRLLVSEQVPRHAQVTRALRARVVNVLPSPLKTRVDLVVPSDTLTWDYWRRSAYNYQLLPARESDRCVAIADALASRDVGARNWIGPCGFYATYGVPGHNIDRWLRSGAWAFGTVWRGSPSPRFNADRYWYPRAERSIPWADAAGFPMRHLISIAGYGCLTGNRAACRPLVLDPQGNDVGSDGNRGAAFRAVRLDGVSVWSRGTALSNRYPGILGPSMANILMDMSTTLGPDKFGRFWKSDLPPADAFRAATGTEIEDWTMRWMRNTYGEFGRGPRVTVWSAMLGAALALLALGLASVTWRRRQVA